MPLPHPSQVNTSVFTSRGADIENERLPPQLVDANSAEGQAILSRAGPLMPEELEGVPQSPQSPVAKKRGHARTQSLGTTRTSPSTRRRSLENTISLIQEVLEGNDIPTESATEATSASDDAKAAATSAKA